MPRISESKESGLKRTIRDIIALDPLISMNGLQRAIEKKTNRPIDEVYLKKLTKKVTAEMAVVADREKVEERISYLRERNRIICDELLRIAFPSSTLVGLERPTTTERLRALESITRIEAAQVKLEMDLGLFTRHLGEIEMTHRVAKPLDEDTRSNILKAFVSWSIPVQARKIEPKAIIEAKTIDVPISTTIQQPTPAPAPAKTIPSVVDAGLVSTG